jgi:hypothetical protein
MSKQNESIKLESLYFPAVGINYPKVKIQFGSLINSNLKESRVGIYNHQNLVEETQILSSDVVNYPIY